MAQWFLSWVCYIRSLREDAMKEGERGHFGGFFPAVIKHDQSKLEREGFVLVYTFTSQSILVRSQGWSSRQEPRERSWSLVACSSLVTQPAFHLECAGPPRRPVIKTVHSRLAFRPSWWQQSLKSDSLLPNRSALYQIDKNQPSPGHERYITIVDWLWGKAWWSRGLCFLFLYIKATLAIHEDGCLEF